MADNVPSSGVPPKPGDSGKVQPKKETVRINLPPKPTASPTIKLPTLPPGGPPPPSSGAAQTTAPATPAGAPRPAPAAPKPPTPPTGGAPGTRVAQAPGQRPTGAAPAATTRRPAPVTPALGNVEKGLAIGVMVVSVIALVSAVFLSWFVTNQ